MSRARVKPWLAVAAGVFCIGWGGNQFTPMLIEYVHRAGYSRVDVDVLLGAYVLGLIPGLLVAAAMSNRYGRRPLMVAGLISSALGSLILATGELGGFPALFVGRLLCGLSVGVAMAVGSTWIAELSAPPYDTAATGPAPGGPRSGCRWGWRSAPCARACWRSSRRCR